MKTVRIYIFVLLFFAILQTSQSDVRANDEWVKLRSKNFQLIGDAGEKDMRETIARLETFREVFTQLFPSIKFNSPIPTTVIVFKTGNSFNLYKSSDAKNKLKIDSSGYFLNGEDTNYIVVSAENLKTGSFGRFIINIRIY